MAYTTINKSTDYFNTKLYTGDGTSSNSITGVGFAPDFLWSKARNGSNSHILVDKVRGATKVLHSNGTNAQQTCNANQDMISLDSDGFTVGTPTQFLGSNTNGRTVAAWNWKAGGGQGSSNTDGTITSTVSANTTSGFSIATYTGNGTSGATFGHGLSSAPEMVIIKQTNSTGNWRVGHVGIDSTFAQVVNLNLTNLKASANSIFNSTAPTSSVVTLGNESDVNGSSNTFVAYCFHGVKGYSKFGSYTGNGNADGTFVYTGFKPAFVMLKRQDSVDSWFMYDNKRSSFNVVDDYLTANGSGAEVSSSAVNLDLLSNGFKLRNTDGGHNNSSGTYIYMAFAKAPLVGTNNVPCTAR